MKVRGSTEPMGAYSIEAQPDKPDYVLIRFYENVEEYTEDEVTGWQWDEYHALILSRDGLAAEVENNLAFWVQLAKDTEAAAMEREALPTPQEDADALLADHEERLIYMELGV